MTAAVILSFGAFWVVAAQSDILPPWAQYGLLGFIIIGFLTQQLVPGWHYKAQQQEIRELKGENSRLVDLVLEIQGKTLPALEQGNSAVREALEEIRHLRGRER